MSAGGRVAFEIQTYKDGRWAIDEVVPTEEAARRKATDLLSLKTTKGVRILKETHFASDTRRATEIFS